MEKLLFYPAILLLVFSVIACIVYNIVYWRKNLQLFEQLLRDENYPFEITDETEFAKTSEIEDFCGRCWAKTAFRNKTEGESKLADAITGSGLFGGVGLFLAFSTLSFIGGIVLGFVFACFLQYIYRNVIYFIAHVVAWGKMRRIYRQYQMDE